MGGRVSHCFNTSQYMYNLVLSVLLLPLGHPYPCLIKFTGVKGVQAASLAYFFAFNLLLYFFL